jgi:hypothetical protein
LTRQFASFFPIRDQDDDIHLIATVKGCLFPWFCCKQTFHHPNRMQIDMTTTNDRPNLRRLDACHCMSLPLAMQNTQYYLQAGCGLACAMASVEMALLDGDDQSIQKTFVVLAGASSSSTCSQKARYN